MAAEMARKTAEIREFEAEIANLAQELENSEVFDGFFWHFFGFENACFSIFYINYSFDMNN
jgi:hypothetical protein